MEDRRLTYAGVSYFDRTHALASGQVKPEGVALDFTWFDDISAMFRLAAQEARYDLTEMSLSTLMMMIGRGDRRLIGLPVFPSRSFRHSQLYVSAASGIRHPGDLRGKKVGVPQYQQTAALWIRGFLQHDYLVHPRDVQWFTGGLRVPGFTERFAHELPEDVHLQLIGEDRTLEDMLATGELDALSTVRAPEAFDPAGGGAVRRLFPDHRAVEREYFQRTRIMPIMHTVALRRDVYETAPAVSVALFDAFETARRQSWSRLSDARAWAVMHPWIDDELRRVEADLGEDPFAYGFRRNRHVVDAAACYSYEQGLTDRLVSPEEIFAAETLDT
jgi:4,5-dihydroxyphthalate decarboxylase